MKKLFFLIAVCLSLLSCTEDHFPSYLDLGYSPKSQNKDDGSLIVAEIDWTTQEEFNQWCSGENGSTAVVGAEGLEINVPSAGEVYWEPQTVVLNIPGQPIAENRDAPVVLAKNGKYKVIITAKHPAGSLQVNLGSWDDGVELQKSFDVAEATDFEDIIVDFSEGWPADCFSNVHVLWQSGALPGLSVLKKIQVVDLNGEEGEVTPTPLPGEDGEVVLAEIDWTTQEEFNQWCSGENGSTAVVGAEGLEINVPSAGEVYWNPQTVVLNIPGQPIAENRDAPVVLAKNGKYKVIITAKHPAGTLQVNLGSWDDDGVSLQKSFDVAEATDFEDIIVDFSEGFPEWPDGWPADCFSNVHVLWQSGALPGLSVLKKVQVLDCGQK